MTLTAEPRRHLAVFDGDHWGSACGWVVPHSTSDHTLVTCGACRRSRTFQNLSAGLDNRLFKKATT